MKWVKALLGLAVIGGFVAGVWYIRENKIKDLPILGDVSVPVDVEEGLEVPLVLLTPLDSGGSEVGKVATLVVADNVNVGGKTVIKQGSVARAKVSRSREGTLIGTVTNQPARLEIELLDVKATDGRNIKLRAHAPGEPFSFTQANTSPDGQLKIADAVADPEAQKFLSALANQIVSGGKLSPEDREKAETQLKDMAKRYGLESTHKFLSSKDSGTQKAVGLTDVLESVSRGDLKGLAGEKAVLAIKAAGEIVDIGSGIDQTLRNMFKGSNIHAKVGTKVNAYAAEKVRVTVPKQRP